MLTYHSSQSTHLPEQTGKEANGAVLGFLSAPEVTI